MNTNELRTLIDDLRRAAEGALLGVGYYEDDEYEMVYTGTDLYERYPAEKIDEIARDMVLEGLSDDHHERLLYDFGGLSATIRSFDRGVTVHVPLDGRSGLGFGLDDPSLTLAGTLLDRCLAFADAHEEPGGNTALADD